MADDVIVIITSEGDGGCVAFAFASAAITVLE